MLNEINCWQCEKRRGGKKKKHNPYKVRIMLAPRCSRLKGIVDNKQKCDNGRKPCLQ